MTPEFKAMKKRIAHGEYQICGLCGGKITRPDDLSQDHILPKSQHGETVPENLLPAHVKCNNERGCLSLKEWYVIQRMSGRL